MTSDFPNNIVIVGCGDIGERVAALHAQHKAVVTAIVRGTDHLRELQKLGLQTQAMDLDDANTLQLSMLTDAAVYYFAPPVGEGTVDTRMQNFLTALQAQNIRPQKIVYISTSGVYGDTRGDWVDETSPAKPDNDRSQRRWSAEQQLRAYENSSGVPVVVIRVGGIYGPGRLPMRQVQSQRPVLRYEESGYTNRIHSDDLAQVCVAAMEKGKAGDIFNATDGYPGTMAQYFTDVALALGYPAPEQITMAEAEATLNEALLSYLRESRRMRNDRIINELGVKLRYEDFTVGLKAVIDQTNK